MVLEMGLESEVDVLKAVPIFRGLDPRRLKLIAFTSQRLAFPAERPCSGRATSQTPPT